VSAGAAPGRARARVLLAGPSPDAAGGVAVVIARLIGSELADRFELVPVTTHRDAGRAGKAWTAAVGIARGAWLVLSRRVDLVYLHASSGFSLRRKAAIALVARLARTPYVLHVHASDFDGYYRSAPGWERRLVRHVLRHAALVIAVSPTWEVRLQAIVPCCTTAIPNLVPVPSASAPLARGDPRVVSLGRIGVRKGSYVLVRALALLAPHHPGASLVLAGDGELGPVSIEAERLGVEERVELPGWVGPAERERILLDATVFALPSRHEGLPVALLEAMAYGLPSVVSPVGGIPDIFVDGRHGFVVPPDDPQALADRLSDVLGDLDAARRMGENARADMKEGFATEVVAERVGDALESVLARE
jgi:glycosyltransferase involved in cell wall biosynthesis